MYIFLMVFLPIISSIKMDSSPNNVKTALATPRCANCIHYIPSLSSMNYTSELSKCNLFYKNPCTNTNDKSASIVLHEYADFCRADETKCGEKGVFFLEERFLTYKVLLHAIISCFPVFLLFSSLVLLISITDYIHNP